MADIQSHNSNFPIPAKGPGRSAPTLIEDLILYDPRQPHPPGQSLSLDDDLRPYTHVQSVSQLLPPGSCQHDFCVKRRQSAPPLVDEKPEPNTIWQIAAVCQKCRIHLLLQVDYTQGWQNGPCPTHENPLHHLVSSSTRQDAAYKQLRKSWQEMGKENPEHSNEISVYECSSNTCSAIVTVHLTPPILTEHDIHCLVDKELLAKRIAATFEKRKGELEGFKAPTPLEVLEDLRIYLTSIWDPDAPQEIGTSNKRFSLRFGIDGIPCAEPLELLGFEYNPSTRTWRKPDAGDVDESIPFENSQNISLDNAIVELQVLIANRPLEERQATQDMTKLDSAHLQMSRVLSCQNYDRDPASRAKRLPLQQRPRPFNILRIPQDASDDLVIWAYRSQSACMNDDVKLSAQLMTSLEDIQRQRQSEKLGDQVAIERSMGRVGEQALAEAYRTIGITSNFDDASDDVVIGHFEARLSDAPAQERYMRESLATIGSHRNSQRIIEYAQNAVSTYADALRYLDANETTDDSFVSTMFTSKISDNPDNQELAQKALRIIAEHRNSESLKAFVTSGFQGEIQDEKMGIGEAYNQLGVEDRTLDDETLLIVYETRVEEPNSNSKKLRKAIETIAEHNNSNFLKSSLQMPNSQPLSVPVRQTSATEPVGLDNIGNTCYLNSLLQWLFTIVTVRKIVLNFEEYKRQELKASTGKRVGQRAISVDEMKSAQRFVDQLGSLFNQMICSSNRAIRPSQELARLTLETETVKSGRRNSTITSQRRPTLGMVDGRPQFGPLPNPAISLESEQPFLPETTEMSTTPDVTAENKAFSPLLPVPLEEDPPRSDEAHAGSEAAVHSSNPSQPGEGLTLNGVEASEEIVLQDVTTSQRVPQTNSVTDNSEPNGPTDVTMVEANQQAHKDEQQTNIPTPVAEQAQHNVPQAEQSIPMIYQPPPGPPPARPPPVPPRNTPTRTLEEWARQQDVSEVINHSIIQLSSAIRPKGYDESGEQQDEIHDTFNGAVKYHYLAGNASPESPRPFLFLFAPIENRPKDLYASLDNGFDRETIQGTNFVRYESITKLPPVLLISLGRAIYDNTGNQRKLNYHVNIPDTLFMDRYIDAPDDSVLVERRMQSWAYKDELRNLQARLSKLEPQGSPPVDESLAEAAAALQHLADIAATDNIRELAPSPSLPGKVQDLAEKTRMERRTLSDRIAALEQQIEGSFTDAAFLKHEYKLHAAFFHRGTVGSGHYWIYIYDHVNEVWRKYNDDYVTPVLNRNEIFGNPQDDKSNPNYGAITPANAYFLVYVRADQLTGDDQIVETLKRDVTEPPMPANNESHVSEVHHDGESGDTILRPLGTDTPPPDVYHDTIANGQTYHHDFSNQPSQMSSLPPDSILPTVSFDGSDPTMAQLGNNALHQHMSWPSAATSQMAIQRNQHDMGGSASMSDWVEDGNDPELEAAIFQSMQEAGGKAAASEKAWDDSENPTHRQNTW